MLGAEEASKQAGKQATSQPSMTPKSLGTFKFLLTIGIKNWRSSVQGCGVKGWIKGSRDQGKSQGRSPPVACID
jgi:hypothetical protein